MAGMFGIKKPAKRKGGGIVNNDLFYCHACREATEILFDRSFHYCPRCNALKDKLAKLGQLTHENIFFLLDVAEGYYRVRGLPYPHGVSEVSVFFRAAFLLWPEIRKLKAEKKEER